MCISFSYYLRLYLKYVYRMFGLYNIFAGSIPIVVTIIMLGFGIRFRVRVSIRARGRVRVMARVRVTAR